MKDAIIAGIQRAKVPVPETEVISKKQYEKVLSKKESLKHQVKDLKNIIQLMRLGPFKLSWYGRRDQKNYLRTAFDPFVSKNRLPNWFKQAIHHN